MTEKKNIIPWIEKYRPSQFKDIVLDPINRTIFQNIINKNIFPNLLFYGPPGVGKCFGLNTPILMYNGEIKMVQDIKIGDILMGDDSKPRRVLSLGRGENEMYEVCPIKNESYIVNSEHILCLKLPSQIKKVINKKSIAYKPPIVYKTYILNIETNRFNCKTFHKREEAEEYIQRKNIIEISMKDFLKLSENTQKKLFIYKKGVEFSGKPVLFDPYLFGNWIGNNTNENIHLIKHYNLFHNKYIPDDYKTNHREIRLQLLTGILYTSIYKKKKFLIIIHNNERLMKDILYLTRSLGLKIHYKTKGETHYIYIYEKRWEEISYKFKVIPKGKGNYYGFEINGNHRFLLGDFSVTHNTSTIINLINEYQLKNNLNNPQMINKGNIIHLNASDERGIDIIRNQIHQFVSTKNLFDNGIKFVVLDEVDYMTKNAQQALKYLLQTSSSNIRFCLICNYVSKIDESLRNEFICIRFNQLPKQEIFKFIENISKKENINLNESMIEKIQSVYHSDIRSMINFIQSNHHSLLNEKMFECIIHSDLWREIHSKLIHSPESVKEYINKISIQYNIDKKQIIQNYFNYVIRNFKINENFLNIVKMIIHNNENIPTNIIIDYFIIHLTEFWKNY